MIKCERFIGEDLEAKHNPYTMFTIFLYSYPHIFVPTVSQAQSHWGSILAAAYLLLAQYG